MLDHPERPHTARLLAANLRRLRIARRLSLSELARVTAISKATLSAIENGHANPTIETVARLAGALGVTAGQLLDVAPVGEIRIVRASPTVAAPRDGATQRMLEEARPGAGVTIAELALAARETHELPAGPAGSRAQVYVLAGRMIAGPAERYTELSAGDYASFPADVPHLYEAARHPARALVMSQQTA